MIDPADKLGNYTVTTNFGLLTILSPPQLSFNLEGGAGGLFTLSWPASYTGFVLEYTENLMSSTDWHEITNGITEAVGIKSYVVTNAPGAPGQFYRLRFQ